MIPKIKLLGKKAQIKVETLDQIYYLDNFDCNIDNWKRITYQGYNGKKKLQEYILGPDYFSNTIYLFNESGPIGEVSVSKSNKTVWSYRTGSYCIWTDGTFFKQETFKDDVRTVRTVQLHDGKQLCRTEKLKDGEVIYSRFYENGSYIKKLAISDNGISFKFGKNRIEFLEATNQFSLFIWNITRK